MPLVMSVSTIAYPVTQSSPPLIDNSSDRLLEKIRHVVAPLLVIVGLCMLFSASFALGAHLLGVLITPTETIQMLFTTGIMSIISGFHITKGTSVEAQISSGPLSVAM